MKFKILLPLLVFGLLLGGCTKKAPATTDTSGSGTKILVNQLPLADRPFTVLVPHTSNRVFVFYTENANKAKTATLDLEYQSGDLLKGARATLDSPIPNPFVKAIILGSCSTGGKCTFDTDLKSGSMKFGLNIPGQNATHLLKGDFTFITGQNNLPDGKVTFTPSRATAKNNLIMTDSFGLPKAVSKTITLYPIVISSATDKNVIGTLTINQSGVDSAAIYDGSSYQPLKYTAKQNTLTFDLNVKPWSKDVTITRDDEQGTQESDTLYLVGPIILYQSAPSQ